MNIRTRIIQRLVHLNENLFFYPKLRKFYQANFSDSQEFVILDVGANKGQSIDFFLKINPKATITAFEPNKKLYNMLLTKYKGLQNIRIYNLGVSNINGELEFHENVLDETSTFEILNKKSKYLAKKAKILGVEPEKIIVSSYKVPVVKLSDFCSENRILKANIIKIDVEGHELQCIKGLFDKNMINVQFIQLENHYDDMYLNTGSGEEIKKILAENEFEKRIEIKHSFGDFTEVIYEKIKA